MSRQIRSLQLVWFLPAEPPQPLALFTQLVGQEADAFQKISPPQTPFPVTIQTLARDDVNHRMQSHVGRVDYFIEGIVGVPGIPAIPYDLSHMASAIKRAADAASMIGNITRAAVVLTLAEEKPNVEAAAEEFEALFGGKLPLKGSRDLMFQVSKRHDEGGTFPVNRLLRWAAENVAFQQILGQPDVVANVIETHYLSYMIDVNTVPEPSKYIPPGDQGEAFARLAQHVEGLIDLTVLENFE